MVDRRTGTTTLELWPQDARPAEEYTRDDDRPATGRSGGISPQATVTRYRRDGITYPPLRDAEPVPVHLIWRRQDPHAAIALLTDLYREDA